MRMEAKGHAMYGDLCKQGNVQNLIERVEYDRIRTCIIMNRCLKAL